MDETVTVDGISPATKPEVVPASPPAPASAPTPIRLKAPKLNWKETQEGLDQIEKTLGGKVICYYTAPEAEINQNHPDLFLDHLRKIGEQEKIFLLLISGGGSSIASLRIAAIVRDYCRELHVLVPSRCASAATNLALAADKIWMSTAGYLTAIDTTLNHALNPKGPDGRPVWVSVDQVKRVLKFLTDEGPAKSENGTQSEGAYRTLFKYLHPMALGEIDRYSSGSQLIATKMMNMHPQSFESAEKIEFIAKHLVGGYPTHGFPIMYAEAKEIGLPVEKMNKDLSNLLWDLVKYYDRAAVSAVTNLSPDFYHYEFFPMAIESLDRRTTYSISYNRRFNPATKIWRKENDNSRWLKITPPEEKGKPFAVSPIDTPEEAPTHPEP